MSDFSGLSVSLTDSIEVLKLSTRAQNALLRSGIRSIGLLIDTVNEGELLEVRNIGDKGSQEILDRLSEVEVMPQRSSASVKLHNVSGTGQLTLETATNQYFVTRAVELLTYLVEQQIKAGLLHPNIGFKGSLIGKWLDAAKAEKSTKNFDIFETILKRPLTIAEEIIELITPVDDRALSIINQRYGIEAETLEEIGEMFDITRERVRQICKRYVRRIDDGYTASRYRYVRIKTALQLAIDMGDALSLTEWERTLRYSGLLGSWPEYPDIDVFELLIAVISILIGNNVLGANSHNGIELCIELGRDEAPDTTIATAALVNELPKEAKKQIRRHNRFSGAVNGRWLAIDLKLTYAELADVLDALGYRHISGDWYMQRNPKNISRPNKNQPFHRSMRKMSMFCGPLSVEDICYGIELALTRTKYPTPPPSVMEEVLRTYSYTFEEGLFYWDGENDEELSPAEQLLFDCVNQYGPVVHHQQLSEAFVNSPFSYASLHATLRRSPIFTKVDYALYALRGTNVTKEDIDKAEGAAEPIPIQLDINFTKTGEIIVELNLSVMAVGIGTIQIYRVDFPNLEGDWEYYVPERNNYSGQMYATEQELRLLKDAFDILNCEPGDRLRLSFNTWDRTLKIESVDRL